MKPLAKAELVPDAQMQDEEMTPSEDEESEQEEEPTPPPSLVKKKEKKQLKKKRRQETSSDEEESKEDHAYVHARAKDYNALAKAPFDITMARYKFDVLFCNLFPHL